MKCLNCDQRAVARQLCQTHYMQERRAGRLVPFAKESPQQFIKNRSKILENGCWEWQLSKFNGYGRTVINKKSWPAHAYSYSVFVGDIPQNKQINHKCHNRSCVNPEHLYAGTQQENVRDMDAAGRRNQARGSRGGNSKITEDIAKKVFNHDGIAIIIAEKYGISISLVYAIKKKQIWRHIHAE
jgi:hypothetical protein